MNETLSVIDEHITDLSTPRQSAQAQLRIPEDSESDYSSHLDRISFLAGPETDEESGGGLTAEEVLRWDQKQTANHLRSLGVDPGHCDIFEDQEITGEVLLEMDQSFIQMKDFDFGVMGKRLKTWHKIRDFQREVRGGKLSQVSSLTPSTSFDDHNRSSARVGPQSTILPRIPSLNETSGLSLRQSQHAHPSPSSALPSPLSTQPANGLQRTSLSTSTSPSAWRSSLGPDSPARLVAAQSGENLHSRRHSSVDFGRHQDQKYSSTSLGSTSTPNQQKGSFERDWAGGAATPASTNITSPSVDSKAIRKPESLDMSVNSPLLTDAPNLDLDRGYFSGNEVDNRKARGVLRKSMASPGHSRQSSLLDEPRKSAAAVKRHSRLSSVDSSRDPGPLQTPASKAYHSSTFKGRFRSASARTPSPTFSSGTYSPTVTNLEDEVNANTSTVGLNTSRMVIPAKARKLMGLRATSEAVTSEEKSTLGSSNITSIPLEESPVASPVGSHPPSITGQSAEIDNTDSSSKGTEHPGSVLGLKQAQRSRAKDKRQTSAYAKGLLKLTPEEARKQSDHCGWMKKKSSTFMTTWKPRLFILRGRRLSYYYSENDTEERGIIDISGHKVLYANSDPMVTLHATLTGAKASPSTVGTSGENSPTTAKASGSSSSGPFYFKLVPPKAGMSRAVQFTKPTVHYFQVDTIAEGRKWMGEIMKATIEHDLTSFETTNKQKTISLAKAKARKERPPALQDTAPNLPGSSTAADTELQKSRPTERESAGLNIKGMGLNSPAQSPDIDAAKNDSENVEPKT